MVVRAWLLIFLLVPVAVMANQPVGRESHCLDCHPVHYAERATCVACHGGHPETRRQNIAHDGLIAARFAAFTLADSPVVQRGIQGLKDYACRRCHVSAGKGNGLGSNLDWASEYAAPEELVEAIARPVLFMPDFRFTEQQRVELVNALFDGARRVDIPPGEVPAVIHFEGEGKERDIQFEKHCGGCHRALTENYGGLGNGLVAPNLSGLFSEFYPENFGSEQQPWTAERLEKWIKNPRKIKSLAQMPPQQLKPAEFERLVKELRLSKPPAPAAEMSVLPGPAETQ